MRVFIVKPDNIGDFVLATGAIRLLIREAGAENVTLCVKTVLVPLARVQSPGVTVLELPVTAKRKVVNLFLCNLWMCSPLIARLRFSQYDVSVCLRSMRTYLETLVFLVPEARRFVANENLLLRSGRKVRMAVETFFLRRLRKAELVDYPDAAGEIPLEIEAHRRVVERVLHRPVGIDEVIPELTLPTGCVAETGDYWLCAPLTSLAKKDYPPARWARIFKSLPASALPARLLLTGSADQKEKLEGIRRTFAGEGVNIPVEIVLPADLTGFLKLIGRANLVLTGDTAAAHFATATDRRALILFSGMHTGMFAPWQRSARQAWLQPTDPSDKQKPKWHDRIASTRAAETITDLLSAD